MTVPIPNFVLIGAAKTGTTSLHRWLGQHPDIFVPRQKGLHFFTAQWLRENSSGPGDDRLLQDLTPTWESYLAHYADAAGRKAIGDVSPSYFSWWPSREAIAKYLGEPRILLVLRDPVQKAFSQYTHLIRDGRETLSFWEALQAEPERKARRFGALWLHLESALYAEPTERFLEYFGRERMKILIFEDLIRDPQAVLREIFAFLGVDPGVPLDTTEAQNRSGAPRSKLLASAVNDPRLRRIARTLLPTGFVSRLGRKATELNTGEKPILDDRSRAFLIERTKEDRRRLAKLLDRRVAWLD
jgi:hypothetical protein